jgi:hypothetical protein
VEVYIMRTLTRAIAGTIAAGALAVGLAACGGSSGGGGSSTGSNNSSSASAKPVAQIKALTGKSTSVKLDPGFTGALTTLGLTPGVVGTGALTAGSLVFPITGGNVTYYTPGSVKPYVQGSIEHKGSGFSLTAGSTKAEFTNFTIDPGTSQLFGDVAVNGTSAAKQAYLFTLDGSTLKPLQSNTDGTATLTGTIVEISPDAAGLLNSTFKTTAVKAGLVVGVATIVVNTK